jgi:hypothetical protein
MANAPIQAVRRALVPVIPALEIKVIRLAIVGVPLAELPLLLAGEP